VEEYPHIHLFNISPNILEEYILHTFWHNAIDNLVTTGMQSVTQFIDSDLILSKSMNFDYNSYLQSKSINQVLKSFVEQMQSKFSIIQRNVYGLLTI
jgi:hypothetical protein